ncbi:Hypothetical_protein [Hexamita inflata]|uniref:Hypothetical_protein n=1 Tax=Hexamita inflata TaxID=28002 RepID=A0AA86QV60_9EUKA|nr:Hypothetical protein HINF_LOCUS54276 [Hexamita inflata]
MIFEIVYVFHELARNKKTEMFNCFTTTVDVNVFLNAQQIILTIQSTQSSTCNIPRGVYVGVQLDSVATEQSAVLFDFDYMHVEQTIVVNCTGCVNVKQAKSALIIIETVTDITYIPVGSIRISKGLSDKCFHDNDSHVELFQGSVVAVLYPSYNCFNIISHVNGAINEVNAISAAKAFIQYSDDSVGIYPDLVVSVESAEYVPSYKYSQSSIPLRIRLTSPDISQYFQQMLVDGKLSKDMKLIKINFDFIMASANPTQVKKTTQVTLNYYKLMGIGKLYSEFNMKLLQNGFYVYKKNTSSIEFANDQLRLLGVNNYVVEYVFTTYDVEKTNTFRHRLMGPGVVDATGRVLHMDTVQTTCASRYVNQGCEVLMPALQKYTIKDLKAYLIYFFNKDQQVMSNFTVAFDNIFDSCFTDGLLDYNENGTMKVNVNVNYKAKSCTLAVNDTVQAVISNAVSKQTLSTSTFVYQNESLSFEFPAQITGNPEIRIQFFKSGVIQDAVALTSYTAHNNQNTNLMQQAQITGIILACNLGITIIYVYFKFCLVPHFKNCQQKKKFNVFKFAAAANQDVEDC